jgi:hypothetical protein
MRHLLALSFLLTSSISNAEEFVILENILEADPIKDARDVIKSGKPYILRTHTLGTLNIPPLKTIEEVSCWSKKTKVKVLDGFSDAIIGYETIRTNLLLSAYAKYFNRQVMEHIKKTKNVSC